MKKSIFVNKDSSSARETVTRNRYYYYIQHLIMTLSKLGSLGLLLSLLLLTGCLEIKMVDDQNEISVDNTEVIVPSDLDFGTRSVKDVISVSCNRSWTINLKEDVDWVTIETPGHLNWGHEIENVPVSFSFLNNEGEERTATAVISSEAGKKEINIRQKGIAYSFAFGNAADELENLYYDKDTCRIKILANSDWKIGVKDGSEIEASFSQTEGKYSTDVDMYVGTNTETRIKEGILILTSKNCADTVEMKMTQMASVPYMSFPQGDVVTALDGIDNFKIPIKTNAAWTASVESVSGYAEGAVSVTGSGEKTDSEVEVFFPASYDFSKKEAQIKVKFNVQGKDEPVYATVKQTPALRCCFGDPYSDTLYVRKGTMFAYADTARIHKLFYPFSKYEVEDGNGGWIDKGDGFTYMIKKTVDKGKNVRLTLKNSGYMINAHSIDGINYTNSYMFIGKNKDVYFGCPVVPGYKLTKVVVGIHNNAGDMEIRDLAGNPISNKSGEKIHVTNSSKYRFELELLGTEKDTEYRICNNPSKTTAYAYFCDLIFYYE